MNTRQKIIRYAGLALLIGMALIPPWKFSSKDTATGAENTFSVGYRALWNPPTEEVETEETQTNLRYRIDLLRLTIQFAVVLAAMNGGVYLLAGSAKK